MGLKFSPQLAKVAKVVFAVGLAATVFGGVHAQDATAEATMATGVTGTFYWVQNTAWHPVHQLTQLSFLAGCEEIGLQCQLATTEPDARSTAPTLARAWPRMDENAPPT